MYIYICPYIYIHIYIYARSYVLCSHQGIDLASNFGSWCMSFLSISKWLVSHVLVFCGRVWAEGFFSRSERQGVPRTAHELGWLRRWAASRGARGVGCGLHATI
jgi:hypothetical protein